MNSAHSIEASTQAKKKIFFRQSLSHIRQWTSQPSLFIWVLHKIENIRERTSSLLAPHDPLGILRSLVLNEGPSKEPLPLLRRLGFVHLVSATGIHLYAIMQSWDRIIQGVCLALRFPIREGIWVSRITSFGLCSALWILSGARPGMLRPGIIIGIRSLARILGFRWTMASPLVIALLLELVLAAYSSLISKSEMYHSGRIIYALAVGGGLFASECFSNRHLKHIGLALGSWIWVALWEGWHTGLIALATPVLSCITLPLACVWAYPALIACIFLNEFGLSSPANSLLSPLCHGLNWVILHLTEISLLPGNLWMVSRTALLIGVLFSCIGLVSRQLALREWKISSALFLLLLCFRWLTPWTEPTSKPVSAAKTVEQLDVGQGDAALVTGAFIRPKKQTGLLDAGSKRGISDDGWIQLLGARQVQQLSWAGISHLDEDHSGGFLRLARLIDIRCIVTPEAELFTERGKAFQEKLRQNGLRLRDWNSGCIPYPTLSVRAQPTSSGRHLNENMGAVWIPLQGGGFYIAAGDASAKAEERIARWAFSFIEQREPPPGLIQKASFPRILKVSHHGSRHSSSLSFIKTLDPTEVWISAGQGNSYGHPSAQVLDKFLTLGIPVFRTDRDGFLWTSSR